mmetsp:Transcript_24454/g.57909  ORF Transcript_24454/g.57909 Transcript_24454/m.57909 type:complete len:115 (+) Transcript_24454:110-454(+)
MQSRSAAWAVAAALLAGVATAQDASGSASAPESGDPAVDPEQILSDLEVWIEDPISIVAAALVGVLLICLVLTCCCKGRGKKSGGSGGLVSPDSAGVEMGDAGGVAPGHAGIQS